MGICVFEVLPLYIGQFYHYSTNCNADKWFGGQADSYLTQWSIAGFKDGSPVDVGLLYQVELKDTPSLMISISRTGSFPSFSSSIMKQRDGWQFSANFASLSSLLIVIKITSMSSRYHPCTVHTILIDLWQLDYTLIASHLPIEGIQGWLPIASPYLPYP